MLMLPALMLIFMGIHLYLVVRLGITPLPQKLDEAYDRVKSEGN
jgi:quinol-cytochrome oxidoreductase complex cytochrome b subunit